MFEENSVREITWLTWRHLFERLPFQNSFRPHETEKFAASKFIRFVQRFRKVPFVIRVNGKPNRRNKAAFSNLSGIVWKWPWLANELLPVINYLLLLHHHHQFLQSARSSLPPRFACYQKRKHRKIWLQWCRSVLLCKKPLSTLKHWTVKKNKKRNNRAIISIQSDFRMNVKLFSRLNTSKPTNEPATLSKHDYGSW